MCSRFLSVAMLLCALAASSQANELRFCADPDSLPSSNRQQQGYENRIAEVVAHELNAQPSYEWQRLGKGFVREVLDKRHCDVLLGVPSNFRPVLTTTPYYRSSYVFVTRRDRGLHLRSFDDPRLKGMKIGVQVVSEEYAPPAQALSRRGMGDNIVGFDTIGDRRSASIVNAVLQRKVDAAIVWGPLAGYFARRHRGELEITPTPPSDPPIPMAFSISLGVRKQDAALRDRLNAALRHCKPEIERILRQYGVPLVGDSEGAAR
jgi:mxaJ protein